MTKGYFTTKDGKEFRVDKLEFNASSGARMVTDNARGMTVNAEDQLTKGVAPDYLVLPQGDLIRPIDYVTGSVTPSRVSRSRERISLTPAAFRLPEDGHARVRLFDVSGRLVATVFDGRARAGTTRFRSRALPAPGIYILRLDALDGSASLRLGEVR
jgi:hypothetical protein